MPKRIPTPTRALVRTGYLNGEGTCRELAEKHGMSPGTVENWCHREKWRRAVRGFDGPLMVQKEPSLLNRADLAARRQAFERRSIEQGEALLDRIEAELQRLKPGEVENLRKLVSCYNDTTGMQRKTLRLDEEAPKTNKLQLNLALMRDEPPLALAGVD